jgi:hypothetical protein
LIEEGKLKPMVEKRHKIVLRRRSQRNERKKEFSLGNAADYVTGVAFKL